MKIIKQWPVLSSLFCALSPEQTKALDLFLQVLQKVRPLTTAHKRNLPEDIANLSRILTKERESLDLPYWTKPAFISAYLYYFLPWNLLRLMRLLPNLILPALQSEQLNYLIDLGSGPLTLPLALWLSRPDLRTADVQVWAQDKSPQPLALGKAIFEELGQILGQPIWQIKTIRGNVATLASDFARVKNIWLISAVNLLNEYCQKQQTPEEDSPVENLTRILTSLQFGYKASLLFIEPGTRLGGKIIMQLRDLAVEAGYCVVAPCPQIKFCPRLKQRQKKTWCHFVFSSEGAPTWLKRLSEESYLTKQSLSLAPLLLQRSAEITSPQHDKHLLDARIISSAFVVPNCVGKARYACTEQGLAVLADAENLASGDLVTVQANNSRQRDAKSGAKIFYK